MLISDFELIASSAAEGPIRLSADAVTIQPGDITLTLTCRVSRLKMVGLTVDTCTRPLHDRTCEFPTRTGRHEVHQFFSRYPAAHASTSKQSFGCRAYAL